MFLSLKNALYFLSRIQNWIFAASLLVMAYALTGIYYNRLGLPAGACPVDTYRSWIYLAIALSLLSLLASFIPPKKPTHNP